MQIVSRYARLYAAFVRNCLVRAMEYRGQFWIGAIVYLVWTSSSLLFISVVFKQVGAVRGWTVGEMFVLYGSYVILESLCYGVLGPNMWRFNSYVREGTLDLVLTKPVNSQFLSSARYMDMNGVANSVVGVGLLIYGLARENLIPSPIGFSLWVATMACGFMLAYAMWFMTVTLTIWLVKLQAAGAVFDPLLHMARFPITIYPERLRMMLTFVLPVAFLTTIPTLFLLGKGGWQWLLASLVTASAFLLASNRFWNFALRHYGSASS